MEELVNFKINTKRKQRKRVKIGFKHNRIIIYSLTYNNNNSFCVVYINSVDTQFQISSSSS